MDEFRHWTYSPIFSETWVMSLPEFSTLWTNNIDFFKQMIGMNKNETNSYGNKTKKRPKLFVLKCHIQKVGMSSEEEDGNK